MAGEAADALVGVDVEGVVGVDAGLLKRLRRAALPLLDADDAGLKDTDDAERIGPVVLATDFSKLRTRALTLLRSSSAEAPTAPASSSVDESPWCRCSACWMSPVDTADERRPRLLSCRPGDASDGEPKPTPADERGDALLDELMVGRMAEGVREAMALADGDLETPPADLANVDVDDESVEALDFGRCSLSESLGWWWRNPMDVLRVRSDDCGRYGEPRLAADDADDDSCW